jgi:hypothetical protein
MLGREYESPLKGVVASSILGGADFINEIRERYLSGQTEIRNIPALKQLKDKPTVQQIQKAVEAELSGDPKLIRKVQLYLCQHYTGMRLKDIGAQFGIGE